MTYVVEYKWTDIKGRAFLSTVDVNALNERGARLAAIAHMFAIEHMFPGQKNVRIMSVRRRSWRV